MEDRGGDRIKFNVGGKLFETTILTLQSAGSDSLLANLSTSSSSPTNPIFIDRDPEIFSVLLSLLRTRRLPSTARQFSNEELAEEAVYYGVNSLLRAVLSPPPLSGIDAAPTTTIVPAADAFVSAFSAGSQDGSIWIAHGGKISTYNWILSHDATVRTHLDEISSLRRASADIAVVGSTEAAGIHFYDVLSGGRHVGSVHWTDSSDHRVRKAWVASIAVNPPQSDNRGGCGSGSVFAALECPHRENCVLEIDTMTLQVASEIGRVNGTSTKTAVPTKLSIVPEHGLIFASTVSGGAFGYSGCMRLWDPRSGVAVWETTEPGSGRDSSRFGDSFADADVDREESNAIYKVCWKSGDVGVADLRKLGGDPWVYLEERSAGLRRVGGGDGSVVHCYKNQQVFVSREGGLEVWSQVEDDVVDENARNVKSICDRSFRRNFVDREDHARRGVIKVMEAGGDRLFLTRERVEGLEVWESSHLCHAATAASFL